MHVDENGRGNLAGVLSVSGKRAGAHPAAQDTGRLSLNFMEVSFVQSEPGTWIREQAPNPQ